MSLDVPRAVRARLIARQWRRELAAAARRLLARVLRRFAALLLDALARVVEAGEGRLNPPEQVVERARVDRVNPYRSTSSGGPLHGGQLVLNVDGTVPSADELLAAHMRRDLRITGRWPS